MSTCEEDHVIPVKDFRYDLWGEGVCGVRSFDCP